MSASTERDQILLKHTVYAFYAENVNVMALTFFFFSIF